MKKKNPFSRRRLLALKIRRGIYRTFFYDPARVEMEERAKFEAAGLDFEAAKLRLDRALVELGRPPFDLDMGSVHWLLLAAYGQTGMPVRRFLELGTFKGETTALAGRLFPEAEIVTVDLPETDPLLRAHYDRNEDESYALYLEQQRANLAKASRAVAHKVNSLFLLEAVKGPFDLVWVDAGHHYPEVAWDTSAAHHLCAAGGVLLFDDVLCQERRYKDRYVSTDVYETLCYLQERRDGKLTFFLKRRNADTYSMPHTRKYVGCYRKPYR
jgi:predicted O-methyltransferase YrrM